MQELKEEAPAGTLGGGDPKNAPGTGVVLVREACVDVLVDGAVFLLSGV